MAKTFKITGQKVSEPSMYFYPLEKLLTACVVLLQL